MHSDSAFSGYVDRWSQDGVVAGWAFVSDLSDVNVEVLLDGVVVGSAAADQHRSDFASIRDGRIGFTAQTAGTVSASSILAERVVMRATTANGASSEIPIWSELTEFLDLIERLGHGVGDVLSPEKLAWIARWIKLTQIDLLPSTSRNLLALVAPAEPVVTSKTLIQVAIPLGTPSLGGTAILGLEGHFFLLGGSNDIAKQFTLDPEVTNEIVGRWTNVISDRVATCTNYGARFIQIASPEKSNALAGFAPESIAGPTSVFAGLAEKASGEDYWLDILGCVNVPSAYAKTDTHFSPTGSSRVANRLLRRLGSPEGRTRAMPLQNFQGDLGSKYPYGGFSEMLPVPEREDDAPYLVGKDDTFRGGVHRSRSRIWRNDRGAPITVLVFGNSVFGTGDSPMDISWWLARAVRDLIFVWSPECLTEKIEEYRPDVVVCQTVERFMPQVPAR